MASITENKKNGKIVSFKFRVFIGRDDEGKQQFKTKIWKHGCRIQFSPCTHILFFKLTVI